MAQYQFDYGYYAGIEPHHYSDMQLQELDEIFEILDYDRSGTVNAKELEVAFQNIGLTVVLSDIQERVKGLDSDGNGVLDYSEFLTLIREGYTTNLEGGASPSAGAAKQPPSQAKSASKSNKSGKSIATSSQKTSSARNSGFKSGQSRKSGQSMMYGQSTKSGQSMMYGQSTKSGQSMKSGQSRMSGQSMKSGQSMMSGQSMRSGQSQKSGQSQNSNQSEGQSLLDSSKPLSRLQASQIRTQISKSQSSAEQDIP